MARPLAIIQMGDPPAVIRQEAGEQSRWFVQVLALNRGEYRVFRPDRHELLPAIDTICGAIISGSWAMVTDRLAWSEETAQWIRLAHALNLPLLGVGYGHQLIAHALGGLVADNPQGSEHGLQLIQIAENSTAPLLTTCPGRFAAWLSHRQTVLRPPEVPAYWLFPPGTSARFCAIATRRIRCSSTRNLPGILWPPASNSAAKGWKWPRCPANQPGHKNCSGASIISGARIMPPAYASHKHEKTV